MEKYLAIDVGGTNIKYGLVTEEAVILEQGSLPTPKNGANDFLKIIEHIFEKYKSETHTIVMSAPGSYNAKEKTYFIGGSLRYMSDINITKLIKERMDCNFSIENDAKCAGIAESMYGSTKPAQDNIYLCLGTGIGGAAFINNKLVEPRYKSGMEFGHMIIQKDGRECKCGSKGCFETYCSMKVLKREISETLELNENETGANIVNEIRKHIDDLRIKPLIEEYVQYLAIGIANLINIFEPEIICIGGSFVYIGDLIIPRLKKAIQEKGLLFNSRKEINIVLASLGNDAGIIGAASLL